MPLRATKGTDNSKGPDLGAVILSPSIASSIETKKTFYNLDRHRDAQLNTPLDRRDGVWFVHGFNDENTVKEPALLDTAASSIFSTLPARGALELYRRCLSLLA